MLAGGSDVVADGYRDVQLSVVATGDYGLGVISEIQVHCLSGCAHAWGCSARAHSMHYVKHAPDLNFHFTLPISSNTSFAFSTHSRRHTNSSIRRLMPVSMSLS